eukprot:6183523-Pleurochrysis_carterae.AAC.5
MGRHTGPIQWFEQDGNGIEEAAQTDRDFLKRRGSKRGIHQRATWSESRLRMQQAAQSRIEGPNHARRLHAGADSEAAAHGRAPCQKQEDQAHERLEKPKPAVRETKKIFGRRGRKRKLGA